MYFGSAYNIPWGSYTPYLGEPNFYDDGRNTFTGSFREGFPPTSSVKYAFPLLAPNRYTGRQTLNLISQSLYHHAIRFTYTGSVGLQFNVYATILDNFYAKFLYERGQFIIRRFIGAGPEVGFVTEYGSNITFGKYADESGHETDLQPPDTTLDKYYTGAVGVTLNVASQYLLAVFTYSGALPLSLTPSSTYFVGVYHYNGAVGLSLNVTSLVSRAFSYIGGVSLALTPGSAYVNVYHYSASVPIALSPQSSYSTSEGYAYTGSIQLSIVPASLVSRHFALIGVVGVQLAPQSVYLHIFTFVGTTTVQFSVSHAFSYTTAYSGAIQLSLSPISIYVRWFTYIGSTGVVLSPSSLYTVFRDYLGSVTTYLTLGSSYSLKVFEIEYFGSLPLIYAVQAQTEFLFIILVKDFVYEKITERHNYNKDVEFILEPYYGNEDFLVNYLNKRRK